MPARVAPPLVKVDALQAQFMSHAENALASNQLSFTPEGKAEISAEFNKGATTMVNALRTSPEDIGQAQHSVGLFAQNIVTQAREEQTQYVHPNIIQRAKQLVCPGLWPFC